MHFSQLLALPALFTSIYAQVQGYNYGATNIDGSARLGSDFATLFTTAQNVNGAPGFTSARLYTTIQQGTVNTPTEAIQAAIDTNTTLLLGLWASAGQDIMTNEIAALTAAISQYGTALTDLIIGISVGSEDLYRISPTGLLSGAGPGVEPDTLVSYIGQVRAAIAGTGASAAPVGHVDTYNDWINATNVAVVGAVDFLGMDAYPYYQTTFENDVSNGLELFVSAYNQTVAVAGAKPVWVTETGWPYTGETMNQAVASTANAQTYWDAVGCGFLFGAVNTWWFTLEDPNFGVVGNAVTTTPLYDLTCPSS